MISEFDRSQATDKANGRIGRPQSPLRIRLRRPRMSLSKRQPRASISTGRFPLAVQRHSSISTIGMSMSIAPTCCSARRPHLRAIRDISRGWWWAISTISRSNRGTMQEQAYPGMLPLRSLGVRRLLLCLATASVRRKNRSEHPRQQIRSTRTIPNPRPKVVSESIKREK